MINRVNVIINEGSFPWYVSALSLFGLHPYSYPSGFSVFLSALSQVLGLNPVIHDYLFSIIVFIFSTFSFFIFYMQVLERDYRASLFVLLLSSTYYLHVVYSWDNLAARGVFMFFYPLPLTLILLSLSNKEQKFNYLFLGLIQLFVLFSIHRLFYFFVPALLFPFVILYYTKNRFVIQNRYIFNLVVFLSVLSISYQFFVNPLFLGIQFEEFGIFPNSSNMTKAIAVTHFFATYFNLIGFMSIIGVIVSYKLHSNLLSRITVLLVLSFSFFLVTGLYALTLMLPLIALWNFKGIDYVRNIFENAGIKKVTALLLLLLVTMLPVLSWSLSNSFLGFSFLIIATGLYFNSAYRLIPSIRQYSFSLATILVSIGFILSSTLAISDAAVKSEGSLEAQNQGFGMSFWVEKNSFDHTTTFGEENSLLIIIGAISGVQEANGNLYLRDNPIIWESMDSEFNITWLMKTQKYLYDLEYIERYQLSYIDIAVLKDGNYFLLSLYKPSFLIYSHNFYLYVVSEGVWYYFYLMVDDTYLLYRDSMHNIHNIYGL